MDSRVVDSLLHYLTRQRCSTSVFHLLNFEHVCAQLAAFVTGTLRRGHGEGPVSWPDIANGSGLLPHAAGSDARIANALALGLMKSTWSVPVLSGHRKSSPLPQVIGRGLHSFPRAQIPKGDGQLIDKCTQCTTCFPKGSLAVAFPVGLLLASSSHEDPSLPINMTSTEESISWGVYWSAHVACTMACTALVKQGALTPCD